MTADDFIAWAMDRPESEHYELAAGEVVAMAPERVAHVRTKGEIYRRLRDAIDTARLSCEAYVDGIAVQVDEHTVYEPDALVRCGEPLAPDVIKITDPLIVIEVLSPSTSARDTGAKLEDYFRLPSVRHYLIVKTENRTVIHHARDAAGLIATRILREGVVRLDPPGIELADFF
ncbi:MAG: Uma2 family endonuclease [Pseudomonadota bacterium]|nr:Uma2 family endonuclease [Pseudomonadota bacterium]